MGGRGSDIELVKKAGIPKLSEKDANFCLVVVSPQCPEKTYSTGLSEVETGNQLRLDQWGFYYHRPLVPDPVVRDSMIYLASDFESVNALMEIKGDTPAVRRKSPDLYSDITSPVIVDGCVYGCYGGPSSVSPYASLRCL